MELLRRMDVPIASVWTAIKFALKTATPRVMTTPVTVRSGSFGFEGISLLPNFSYVTRHNALS